MIQASEAIPIRDFLSKAFILSFCSGLKLGPAEAN
jgi:hypothetical protein